MRASSWFFAAAVVSACGPAGMVPGPTGTGGGAGGGSAVSGPTWAQDVAPIVSENCSGCHNTGGIAPFALESYADAKPEAVAMAADVASKKMPPWMPGSDTPELLHARILTDAQISIMQTWANNGAPEGDESTAAVLPPPEVIPFGPADVTVNTGADYVPDATLTDDYRCFMVPLGITTDRMAAAFEVTPGNRKVVHHVIVTLFDPSSVSDLQALDDQYDGPGWQCFGGPVPSTSAAKQVGSLGAWVPGVSAVRYPNGTANTIPANAIAVIQVHYNLAGGDDPDRTQVAIELVPSGQESGLLPIRNVALLRHNLQIPPGAMGLLEQSSFSAATWAAGKLPASGSAWMIGVAGHMHLLGTRIELIQTDAAGDHVLLDIPAWDFHWQGVYYFDTAIEVHAADMLSIKCTYNNPGSTMVTWGEGTADEMCLGQIQTVDTQPPSTH